MLYCDSQARKENERMSKLPDLKELETCPAEGFRYDFALAERLLQGMDFVRKEAVNTHIPEIVTMVDASFSVLATSYYCILRSGKMPRLERLETWPKDEQGHDYVRMEQILSAMDFLRKEAVNTRIDEIVTMIDACFRLLVTAYYCILRYEMEKLPGTDDAVP